MGKKKTSLFMLLLVLVLTLSMASGAYAASISKKKVTLTKGQSVTLTVNGAKKAPKWSSSNKKVASVSKKGVVKAKKKGSATITAKVGKKTYKCKVKVKEPKPAMNATSLTLTKGATYKLKVNNLSGKFTWSTSNKKVASVSGSGSVKGLSEGTAVISAKSKKNKKTYKCKVTVKAAASKPAAPAKKAVSISVKFSKDSVPEGYTFSVTEFTVTTEYEDGSTAKAGNFDVEIVKDTANKVYRATATSGGLTSSISIPYTVKDESFTSIKIECNKSAVEEDHTFTNDEFTIRGYYADGTSKPVAGKLVIKKDTENKCYRITATAEGFTATTNVPYYEVAGRTLESVQIVCNKEKVKEGYQFTLDDFTITGTYTDGTTKTLTGTISWKQDTDRTVYVVSTEISGIKASIDVPYEKNNLKSIEVTCNLESVDKDYSFTLNDFVVTGTYEDGTVKEVGAYNASWERDPATKTFKVTVTADGITKTIQVPYTGEEEDPQPSEVKWSVSLTSGSVKVGEDLAPGQVVVTKTVDGVSENVTDFTTDFTPKNEPGDYQFNVMIGDQVCGPLTVHVVKETRDISKFSVTSIYSSRPEFGGNPVIFPDEVLDQNTMTATVVFSDGETVVLAPEDYTVVSETVEEDGHFYRKATATYDTGSASVSANCLVEERDREDCREYNMQIYGGLEVKAGEALDSSRFVVTVTTYGGEKKTVSEITTDFVPTNELGAKKVTVSWTWNGHPYQETIDVTVVE